MRLYKKNNMWIAILKKNKREHRYLFDYDLSILEQRIKQLFDKEYFDDPLFKVYLEKEIDEFADMLLSDPDIQEEILDYTTATNLFTATEKRRLAAITKRYLTDKNLQNDILKGKNICLN